MAKISTKRLLAPWHLGLSDAETAAQLVVENPNRISEHPGKQRASLGGIIVVKANPLAGELDDRAEPVSRSRHGRREERMEGKAIGRGNREGGI